MESYLNPKQPYNPTDDDRHKLLKLALENVNREEDFKNIVELLKPPTNILKYSEAGSLKEIKVGIIGGGAAGMSAAFELRKLGCDITIFEANDKRIGGRMYTHYFDEDKKLYGEFGALRIPVSHETTWHYINLFNLNTIPFVQNNPNSFLYVLNTRLRNKPEQIEKKLYTKFKLNEKERETSWRILYNYGFNYPMNRLPLYIRSEILKILPSYNPNYVPLLNLSLRENFELLGLSNEAIQLLLSVDSFSGSLADISYDHFLSQNYPVDLAYLYTISGGISNLPQAFYKSLTSENPKEYVEQEHSTLGKVKWKRGHLVYGIHKADNEGKVIIKHRNEKANKDEHEEFDYIVCAIPFTTLRTVDVDPVFSNRKMQAIREITYLNGQRTLFLCNKRFWEEDNYYGGINGGISYTDLSITNIIYPSDHILKGSPKDPGVLMASYNLHRDATSLGNADPEVRSYVTKRQVEQVHGLPKNYLESVVRKVKFLNWNDQPWSRGAVCNFSPEQKRIFSYEMTKPEYDNRIFFAGEHISSTHAWIQGALYTGMQAANRIAKCATAKKYE